MSTISGAVEYLDMKKILAFTNEMFTVLCYMGHICTFTGDTLLTEINTSNITLHSLQLCCQQN